MNGWITPWVGLDAALNVVAQFALSAGIGLLATYAMLFGRPVSSGRRILTAITCGVAALSAILWTAGAQGTPSSTGAAGIAGLWFGTFDGYSWLLARPALLAAVMVVPCTLPLVCALLAVRDARGSERARVAWATGSLAVLFLFGIATIQSCVTSDLVVYYWILNLSWFIAPLGLIYALLSRRLLDVGFVLNRVAVFTAVSLFVVGSFTLAEWALGGWLHSANRVTNVAVSAALALALGLSIHPIHLRVDRLIDNVFFRKRHEDERALHRFAREATYMTDSEMILRRAAAALEEHADCTSIDFLLHDDANTYGGIDENDAALVTLRESHEIVDLHGFGSALRGEFAYPMLARGRLVGVLVLGPKRSGEARAPDESRAIAQLAHGVAVALDLLGVERDGPANALLDAVRTLEQSNRTLAEGMSAIAAEVRALSDAIAERTPRDRTTI